jgi:hypothetical protein
MDETVIPEKRTGRGGWRRNAGRKLEKHGVVVKKHTVTYDDQTGRLLAVLGGGNVSRGIRVAARFAYDGYQSGRLKLPTT